MSIEALTKKYADEIMYMFCYEIVDEEWEKIRARLTLFAEELLRTK